MKLKASITAEASVVCPIFIFVAVALIELIRWFGYAEMIQRKLTEEFNTAQYMAYVIQNNSKDSDDLNEINLKEDYVYDANTFGINVIKPHIRQSIAGRAYTGIMTLEKGHDDTIVYITPHGTVYHVSGACTYLKSDIYRVNYSELAGSRNNSGGKYYACEKCNDTMNSHEIYITPYGNRYHIDLNCSAITRDYLAVYIEDVKYMRCCSKCGE